MAKIIEIQDTPTSKTIVACLAEKCVKGDQHIEDYHRSWTWDDLVNMSEADMIREVKLLIKSALKPQPTPKIKTVSIKV